MHLSLTKSIYRPVIDFYFFSDKTSSICISAASGLSTELLALATAYYSEPWCKHAFSKLN